MDVLLCMADSHPQESLRVQPLHRIHEIMTGYETVAVPVKGLVNLLEQGHLSMVASRYQFLPETARGKSQ